ncbi:hypothetical protein TCON_2141 [Astathelohania contejeani]|uniref:Uncharacterized protein n=1 Tax=Astathelohania contejeani TaxID=164912 RepID=A0ABQ7HWX1_9MICR|nr:hypothetical protein TCON_2141 [Thelohania contejeani]
MDVSVYRRQIGNLEDKEIEKISKKLKEEELEIFIKTLEEYNNDLESKALTQQAILKRDKEDLKKYLMILWKNLPEYSKESLASYFNDLEIELDSIYNTTEESMQ